MDKRKTAEYELNRAATNGVTLARLAALSFGAWEAFNDHWYGVAVMMAVFYLAGLLAPVRNDPPD